mgnify:CR=1 FL=1
MEKNYFKDFIKECLLFQTNSWFNAKLGIIAYLVVGFGVYIFYLIYKI